MGEDAREGEAVSQADGAEEERENSGKPIREDFSSSHRVQVDGFQLSVKG